MNKTYKLASSVAAVAMAFGLHGCGDDGSPSASAGTPPPYAGNTTAPAAVDATAKAVSDIQNVVVIYAENRSFDNLYSDFPGTDSPLAQATYAPQVDRDGKTVLPELPPVWGGLTAAAQSQFAPDVATVTEAQTRGMANKPFPINDDYKVDLNAVTRDMWHNFYQNQMQINGGKNDMFAAWADSGGLVMGYFTHNASKLPLWKVARKYTMADHFFMGAFGGSFLNHQYLVSAAAPVMPTSAPFNTRVAALDDGPTGYHLTVQPAAVGNNTRTLSAAGIFVNGGSITPDGYAINTMQPPYQPSGNAPAAGATGDQKLLADPNNSGTVPPQTGPTIGDYLTNAKVGWAWYAGGWAFQTARATDPAGYVGSDYVGGKALRADGTAFVNFQFHHQPFNYYKRFDPTTTAGRAERAEHLRDGGVNGENFIADIRAGKLPPVTFYKPVGNLNEHAGYTDVQRGDQHIADIVAELEKSPQWAHMLVVVTYDENGGIWDHVAPPKGDRFGPGSRVPALIIGPTVRQNFVDHQMNDTTSILRFITRRWNLPELPGLKVRREALQAGGVTQGDLSEALRTDS
jgi:acid phosphatase